MLRGARQIGWPAVTFSPHRRRDLVEQRPVCEPHAGVSLSRLTSAKTLGATSGALRFTGQSVDPLLRMGAPDPRGQVHRGDSRTGSSRSLITQNRSHWRTTTGAPLKLSRRAIELFAKICNNFIPDDAKRGGRRTLASRGRFHRERPFIQYCRNFSSHHMVLARIESYRPAAGTCDAHFCSEGGAMKPTPCVAWSDNPLAAFVSARPVSVSPSAHHARPRRSSGLSW